MGEKLYDVVGMGRAFTDIVASVDYDFLQANGLAKGSSSRVSVHDLTRIQEQLPGYRLIPGGPIGNTIAGVAALGGRAAFLGATADDSGGQKFRRAFFDNNIDFPSPPIRGRDCLSPSCLVLVTQDGDRTMPYSSGVGDRIPLDGIAQTVVRARVLFIQGNLLFSEAAQPALRLAISAASASDCRIFTTLHTLDLNEADRAQLPDKLAPFDGFLASRLELESNFPETPIGRRIPARPLIVMTDGSNGAYLRHDGRWKHEPARLVDPVLDTTGAGDQLAAGVLLGYARSLPLQDALRLGIEAASAVLQLQGGRPDRDWSHLYRQVLGDMDSALNIIPPPNSFPPRPAA